MALVFGDFNIVDDDSANARDAIRAMNQVVGHLSDGAGLGCALHGRSRAAWQIVAAQRVAGGSDRRWDALEKRPLRT